jgi:acyl carrier protein phosphodiesterase
MNFLGHLWIADRTGTSMVGAILGDMVRGTDYLTYPEDVALGIRLHRRIDVTIDRHPIFLQAGRSFPEGPRRYAPVLMDLVTDHCLALHWSRHSDEPLSRFARRAGNALQAAGRCFLQAGHDEPRAEEFAGLLLSYATEHGMESVMHRTARRLRRPEPMIEAIQHWPGAARALEAQLGTLLADLLNASEQALLQLRPASD